MGRDASGSVHHCREAGGGKGRTESELACTLVWESQGTSWHIEATAVTGDPVHSESLEVWPPLHGHYVLRVRHRAESRYGEGLPPLQHIIGHGSGLTNLTLILAAAARTFSVLVLTIAFPDRHKQTV